MSTVNQIITQALHEKLGCKEIHNLTHSPHGVLNQCFTYETDKGKFFVKVNSEYGVSMYAAEAKGLQSIKETETLRVPTPHYYGQGAGHSFLILEYLNMSTHTPVSQRELGMKLAQMHLLRGVGQFGYDIDNTIGTTPQINAWSEAWVAFFIEHRLEYQLNLAEKKYGDSEIRRKGEKFISFFPRFFVGVNVSPSLLHGDLWGGNTAADENGNPVVYDPAVYYGHHEADFGILLMFGGFTSDFHQAYRELIPKEPGFEERQLGYQLYHYLNHYNLFGSSYRPSCLSILEKL